MKTTYLINKTLPDGSVCLAVATAAEWLEVTYANKWRPTRIEMAEDWYLVGVRADDLSGLRVRI